LDRSVTPEIFCTVVARVASLDETLDRPEDTFRRSFETLIREVTVWLSVRSAVSTLVETFIMPELDNEAKVVTLVETLPTSSVIREFRVETSPLDCIESLVTSLASRLETFN
jgi:hypothetical protein